MFSAMRVPVAWLTFRSSPGRLRTSRLCQWRRRTLSMRVAVGATTLRGGVVGPLLLLPNESFPQQVNDRLAIVLDVSVYNFPSQAFPGFCGRQQVAQEEIDEGGRDVDGLTNPDGVAVGRRHIKGATRRVTFPAIRAPLMEAEVGTYTFGARCKYESSHLTVLMFQCTSSPCEANALSAQAVGNYLRRDKY